MIQDLFGVNRIGRNRIKLDVAWANEDKVRLYSVFGGIPYYNRLIDSKKTVQENIIELIASPGARLETEISLYLKSELAKIANANEVFETLAKGFYRYSDIFAQSHISSAPTLIDVLERLMKMEVVRKTAPINDERNKKKQAITSAIIYRYFTINMFLGICHS